MEDVEEPSVDEDTVVGAAGAGVVVGEAVGAGGDVVPGVVIAVSALKEDIVHMHKSQQSHGGHYSDTTYWHSSSLYC